jgi:hypothetical protein
MKILFNLLLFIPLLVDLKMLLSPVEAWEMGKRFRTAKKENPDSDSYIKAILGGQDGSTLKSHVLAYIIILLGLLSSQWVIFLIYITFGIIANKLRLHWIIPGVVLDSLVGVSLIAFAIINGLHLHYDIYNLLISMF